MQRQLEMHVESQQPNPLQSSGKLTSQYFTKFLTRMKQAPKSKSPAVEITKNFRTGTNNSGYQLKQFKQILKQWELLFAF